MEKKLKFKLLLAPLLICLGCAAQANPNMHREAQLDSAVVTAKGNTDDSSFLSWLGPLPTPLTPSVVQNRMNTVFMKIKKDLASDKDAIHFVCKKPEEVGPTPMMNAVEKYIAGFPESRYDPDIMNRLNDAARAGNWLARVQIYAVLSEHSGKTYQAQMRVVQLMEWLQEHRIGALYAFFGDDLAASGYYSDIPGDGATGIDIFAALNHSYPSQNKVGKELRMSSDPAIAAAGERMLACASNALPAYASQFKGGSK